MYHNKQAEMSVLGSCLVNNECIPEVLGLINDESFYPRNHSEIFTTITSLHKRQMPVDPVTVANELKSLNKLDECGGSLYLMNLMDGIVSTANVLYHAGIVAEEAHKRKLWNTSQEIQKLLNSGATSSEVKLAIKETTEAVERGARYKHASDYLVDAMARIDGYQAGDITGILTPWQALNKILNGFEPEDYVILAARPSHGKSTIAGNMLSYIAQFLPCGLVTLEDTGMSFMMRRLAQESYVDSVKFRQKNGIKSMEPILESANKLSSLNLYIDDKSSSIEEIEASITSMVRKHGVQFVVLDYIGLITGKKAENRNIYITQISADIKALAKKLGIVIVVVSQLSREVEKRKDCRPMASDLRDSGSLEQDSDIIILAYQPQKYGINEDSQGNSTKGLIELIVDKQRNGPTGSAWLAIYPEYSLLTDIDRTAYQPSSRIPDEFK